MKKLIVLLSTTIGLLGFAFGTASAQTVPSCNNSTFDTFATGTVNNQGGWHVSGDFDQEVVLNTFAITGFGCKSLRISDATTSIFIYNQVFSNPATSEVGEKTALDSNEDTNANRNNHFEAQFDLASVMQAEQPGMHLSVSPDRGDGTRMSSIGFEDTASGINVYFDEVTGSTSPITFINTQIASNLTRATAHTMKIVMDFLEGASNDIVKVFIDGNLVHTGTSWENFYRYDADAWPAPTPNSSRTVNSLVFYERGSANPSHLFGGYLIDNVSLSSTTTSSTSTTTPPVITLNGSSTMSIFQNSVFTDPGATAVDSNSNAITVTATGTVNTAVIGGYTILYTATDSNSNIATTTRTVNVLAAPAPTSTSTVPVITLNGSSTVNLFAGTSFTDPGATAVSGTTTVPVTATGTVNTSAAGNYSILYTATSSSNEVATTTRVVNVFATSTAPTITLNGSSTMNLTVGGSFTDPGATAVDAVGNAVAVTATGTVNTSTVGTYTVLYSATDQNNNTATTSRTVTVAAAPAPVTGGVGGGGSSGGGFFIFSPLPGISTVPSTNPSTGGSPITISVVSTPTGQVLGVAVYNFKRNLRMGSTGDDVQELQKYLISQGYLVLKNPTKYFGSMTARALAKWQRKNNLPATGYFGPMSRAAILR